MSLKEFCSTHPPQQDLKEILGHKKSREGRFDRSLVGLLAEDMTKAAGEGLRGLTKGMSQSATTISPDSSLFRQMAPETLKAIFEHNAAIIFGVSLVGIEDTLLNREFDGRGWADRYNMAMSGTPFSRITFNQDAEELTDAKWRLMIAQVSQDRTLSIFFKEGIDALPTMLRRILHESGQLIQIRATIIPIFQDRARFLVG